MPPLPRLTVVTAALLAATFATAHALAEPKCPPGQRPSLRGCTTSAPLTRTTSSTSTSVAPTPKRAAVPSIPSVSRETHSSALHLAERRSLIAELQRLELLLARTPQKSPDRPQILRRLAEGYAELERAAVLEHETAKLRAEREERAHRDATAHAKTTGRL